MYSAQEGGKGGEEFVTRDTPTRFVVFRIGQRKFKIQDLIHIIMIPDALDTGHWTLDTGHWTLDTEH